MVKPTEKGKLNAGEYKYLRRFLKMFETSQAILNHHEIIPCLDETLEAARCKIIEEVDSHCMEAYAFDEYEVMGWRITAASKPSLDPRVGNGYDKIYG